MHVAPKPRARRALILAGTALCLALAPTATRADSEFNQQVSIIQRTQGAAGNADIADIIARANLISAAAAACQGLDCPELQTCALARQLEQDMADLISLVRAQQKYLEFANQAVLDHFRTLVQNEQLTGEARARLIEAIAWQEALIRFSDSMAAAATIISSTKSVIKSIKGGSVASAGNALDVLKVGLSIKTLQDSLLNANSVAAEPGSGLSAGDARGIAGSLGGALGQVAEAQSELTKAAKAAETVLRAGGFDVVAKSPTASQTARAALMGFNNSIGRADSLLVPVGEIVQTVLSSFAKQQLGERHQRMEELIRQTGAEGVARANAFQALQQVQARRFATIDALAALEAAHVGLLACMTKAKCAPGSRTDAARQLPDFSYTVPGTTRKAERWGSALAHIFGEVEKLRTKINPVGAINKCPANDRIDDLLSMPFVFAHDSTTFCTFGEGNPEAFPVITLPPDKILTTPPPGGAAPPSTPPGGPATTPPTATPTPERGPCDERADLLRKRKSLGDTLEVYIVGGAVPADFHAGAANEELKAIARRLDELNKICPKLPEGPVITWPRETPTPTPEKGPCEDRKRDLDEQIKTLDAQLKTFERVARAGAPVNEVERSAAEALRDRLKAERGKLDTSCPAPATAPPAQPPASTPPAAPPPPTIINVKATTAALQSGANATDLGGQTIKLFAPSQLAQGLPSPGRVKLQDDHAADPIQGVTDANGNATLLAEPDILPRLRLNFDVSKELDSGITLGGRIRVEMDAAPKDSVNMLAPSADYLVGLSYKDSLYGKLVSLDRIGDYTVGTLVYDKSEGPKIEAQLKLDFPTLIIEPNLCRIKEPAAVTEYHACKLGDRMVPPGERTLPVPPPHAELPGSALALPGDLVKDGEP